MSIENTDGIDFSSEKTLIITGILFITGFIGSLTANIIGAGIVVLLTVSATLELLIPAVFTFSAFAVIIAVYLGVSRRGLSYIDAYMLTRKDAYTVIGGTITVIGTLVGINGVITVFNLPAADHPLVMEARTNPEILAVLFVIVFTLNAPIEELYFRNILQKRVGEELSPWVAILVTSALFTVFHVPTLLSMTFSIAVIPSLFILFCVSIVFGVVYEETQNIIVPIIVHAIYNAVQLGYIALTIIM